MNCQVYVGDPFKVKGHTVKGSFKLVPSPTRGYLPINNGC